MSDSYREDDEQLVERLRSGDASALDAVSERYRAMLLRFGERYLRGSGSAEDVVQEVFARLLEPDGLPSGPLKPWLYRLARNRCLDILRRYQRSPTYNRPLRTGVDVPRLTAGPGTRAAREERRALIRALIEDMPEEYRSVLMLKYFEGLARAEIATALELTEQAVKGRMVRASAYLHEQLRRITSTNP